MKKLGLGRGTPCGLDMELGRDTVEGDTAQVALRASRNGRPDLRAS
jgi:hypothetical protein